MNDTSTLLERPFGNTGSNVPIVGLGTGPAGMGLHDDEANVLYHWAIDNGITYIDTAPGYERAHAQLKPVLEKRRNEVFLASKSFSATEKEIREGLEKGLEDLGVDTLDLFYIHSLGEHDWDTLTADDGAFRGIFKAKEEGLVANVGFTAHNRPHKSARAINQYPFDAIMLAMNIADRFTYDFETVVLPEAAERGVGVAAMKVFGGAADMKYAEPVGSCFGAHGFKRFDLAMRYCLTLPAVSTVIVGVYSVDELKQVIGWAQNTAPLSGEELSIIDREGKRISRKVGTHFGPLE